MIAKIIYLLIAINLVLLVSSCADRPGIDDAEQDAPVAEDSTNVEDMQDNKEDVKKVSSSEEVPSTEEFSTSLGELFGAELRDIVSSFDQDAFGNGFRDGFTSQEPIYDAGQLQSDLDTLGEHAAKTDKSSNVSDPYDPGDSVTRLSYAIGYMRGSQSAQFSPELQVDLFLASISRSYKGLPYNIDVVRAKVMRYIEAKQQQTIVDRKEIAMSNLKKSTQFLAENKQQKGIITTSSGLQYTVLESGEGDKPKAVDSVEVHYEGKLLDGSVFDSSYQRNQTATFPLKAVIAGWTEGMQYMNVGSKFRFFIPPDLGYGQNGAGNNIGPNELLIFDVELIAIR